MVPTLQQLQLIAGSTRPANTSNLSSIAVSLETYGKGQGLDLPHRLTQFIAQVFHEGGAGRYDEEIASGAAYEGRKDLGNTQPGDGKRFKGRGPIQVTGRSNYQQFTDWCRKNIGPNSPDFVANPDAVKTDPWEGLSAIWYWSTRKLNAYADENNIEQITKKINGGLNGYEDRIKYYVRAALVLLGFEPEDVKGFQAHAQELGLLPADTTDEKQIDGDAGPKTRAALHQALVRLGSSQMTTVEVDAVKPAPVTEKVVVETTVEKPVVPQGADKPGLGRWFAAIPLLGTPITAFGGLDNVTKGIIVGAIVIGIAALIWRGEQIAQRARKIISEFGD